MIYFTTEDVRTLVNEGLVNDLFRAHLEKAVNDILKAELDAFLGYEKNERVGEKTDNRRNGTYDRHFDTEMGRLNLKMPRDRKGEFQNQTLEPYATRNDTLENTIIAMYQKGMTTQNIANVTGQMYGHHYSKQTISNITEVMSEAVDAFNKRRLPARYIAVFLDATVIPIRRDTVEKEAVHIALGIREDGTKEIISYVVAPTESAAVWSDVLDDIRERGVEEVLLFVTDGLSGLKNTITDRYTSSQYQTCLIHVGRNIAKKVRVQDRKAVSSDFKKIYDQKDRKAAQECLDAFISNWKKIYPKITSSLAGNDDLFTFYNFPVGTRKTFYSTNLIEGYNSELKRYTKHKIQFPNEDSLDRFIVARFNEYNEEGLSKCHHGFAKNLPELQDMFKK